MNMNRYGAFVLGVPTIMVGLIACLCLYNGARMEAQTARPVTSKALSSYQWVLTSLTSCTGAACYPQAGGANDTVDMYVGTVLGQNTNSGVASAGVVVIAGAATLTFSDGNGVAWATSVFPAASSGTVVYPLGALLGVYFAKGVSVTCSGGGCAAAQLQLYYQR
jgi:hypothetical protein